MVANNTPNLKTIQNEKDRIIVFDQYKIIVESLDKLNEIREAANNFWIGINVVLMGAIAYIRDAEGVGIAQKSYFGFTIIFLGLVMSVTWINYLLTIKKSVDIRNEILIGLEKDLPVKFITIAIRKMGKKIGGSSLSYKEMVIPILFFIGYIFFAILIYIYPRILASSSAVG